MCKEMRSTKLQNNGYSKHYLTMLDHDSYPCVRFSYLIFWGGAVMLKDNKIFDKIDETKNSISFGTT